MIMIALRGNRLVTKAPSGAAITPPVNNPRMTFQWVRPMVTMKTMDSVSVTKNSEKLTEPMVLRGECPKRSGRFLSPAQSRPVYNATLKVSIRKR